MHASGGETLVEAPPTARIPWQLGALHLTRLARSPGRIPKAIALQRAAIPKQIRQGNPCT